MTKTKFSESRNSNVSLMRSLLFVLLALVMVGSVSAVTQIITIEDLDNIRNNLTGHYILMNDLDFNDPDSYSDTNNMNNYTMGEGWNPIADSFFSTGFSGIVDGDGFVIRNLFINTTSDFSGRTVGFIGMVNNGGVIRNIGFIDVNISSVSDRSGTIGRIIDSHIHDVFSTGTISGKSYTGLLIGDAIGSNISRSFARGELYHTSTRSGGFIGQISNSNITNSYANVDILESGSSRWSGGFVGNVLASDNTITNVYSTGIVSSTHTDSGGLIGVLGSGSIVNNSYWDTETSGKGTSKGGEGKTTNEMMDITTFFEWDIINVDYHDGTLETSVWFVNESNDYPRLYYEGESVLDPFLNSTIVIDSFENETNGSYNGVVVFLATHFDFTNISCLTSFDNATSFVATSTVNDTHVYDSLTCSDDEDVIVSFSCSDDGFTSNVTTDPFTISCYGIEEEEPSTGVGDVNVTVNFIEPALLVFLLMVVFLLFMAIKFHPAFYALAGIVLVVSALFVDLDAIVNALVMIFGVLLILIGSISSLYR